LAINDAQRRGVCEGRILKAKLQMMNKEQILMELVKAEKLLQLSIFSIVSPYNSFPHKVDYEQIAGAKASLEKAELLLKTGREQQPL